MLGERPDTSNDYSRIINEFHTERIENLIKTAGGKIICGGDVNLEHRYVSPTIIVEPNKDAPIMKEEIFGPVLPVFAYEDFSEVINMINSKEKPLAVYYFGTKGSENERRLANETSSGAFVTNDLIIQAASNYTGFGGVGHSGTGRYGGFEGFKNFSNRKGMITKKPAPTALLKGLMPPYDEDK